MTRLRILLHCPSTRISSAGEEAWKGRTKEAFGSCCQTQGARRDSLDYQKSRDRESDRKQGR
jgi:hypothetical protein